MTTLPSLQSGSSQIEGDHLIIVPGFLTEQSTPKSGQSSGQLEHIAHQIDQHASKKGYRTPLSGLDIRGWEYAARRAILPSISTHLFHWPSQSVLNVIQDQLFPFFKETFKSIHDPSVFSRASYKQIVQFHTTWREALTHADQSVPHLYHYIQEILSRLSPSNSLVVLGHSLGGRIILKTLDLCRQKMSSKQFKQIRWIGWAPALTQRELPLSFLDSSISLQTNQLEISYSDHDRVLRYLFPLGQMTISGVMGLDLAQIALIMLKESKTPSQVLGAQGMTNPPLNLHQVDLSNHGIGHFDYLPYFHLIAQKSQILKPRLSPVP